MIAALKCDGDAICQTGRRNRGSRIGFRSARNRPAVLVERWNSGMLFLLQGLVIVHTPWYIFHRPIVILR